MIQVNEKSIAHEPGMTVADLLKKEGVSSAIVAVWMNDRIVPRDSHATTVIPDEAVIQIVLMAPGG